MEPVRFGQFPDSWSPCGSFRKWIHGARVVRSTLVSGGSFCGRSIPRERVGRKLDDRPGDTCTDEVGFGAREVRATSDACTGARDVRSDTPPEPARFEPESRGP